MPNIPSLEELLKAGVHFGHSKGKRHPKMEPYIFTEKNGVHVIDLIQTQKKLEQALDFIKKTVALGGTVLFVGTKKQAQKIIAEKAKEVNMPYINERWLGGTLTNFRIISALVNKYVKLKKKKEEGELKKYTKKEQFDFDKQIEKMEKQVGGLVFLKKLPDILFLLDPKGDKTAIPEAKRKGVKTVAVCDTNTNPDNITYPIPANDDATKSISLILNLIAEAVREGKEEFENKKVEEDKNKK